MIPKSDCDSTPLGQRHLSVLPVVYRLWASLRLGHLREWVEGWLPKSVYNLGNGLSSVEAWFSTALDIEEVLSGIGGDQLHVMVADVIKSFDTVDRSILDCTLGRLGLPDWFRKVYFSFHSQVRLRFKLAAGLGEPWCRDGGIPQGCPLSMVFIVALYVPWCRRPESLLDIKPQLYADNLKCSAARPRALFESAYFTAKYVRLVGQDVSLGKCVLLSTSKAVRRAMKLWTFRVMVVFGRSSLMSGIWEVILISRIVLELVLFLVGFVVLLLVLLRLVWFVVSICLLQRLLIFLLRPLVPLGLLLFVRFGLLRCLFANALAILDLLDGPVDVDPAFYVVWSRFRMMRRYLAYCPEEELRIFRMLDLISRGAPGHGPVHLLLISAAEIGFAWDGDEKRLGPGFPPSLAHDGWSYSAFSYRHSGCLAFSRFFQAI